MILANRWMLGLLGFCVLAGIFSAAIAPGSRAEISAQVLDADGHSVPDATVGVAYQSNGDQSAMDGYSEGVTNTRGQWKTTLFFPANITPAQYAQIQVYTPFWSSERLQAHVSTLPNEELSVNITVPMRFSTLRLRLRSNDVPIPGATVRIVQPAFAMHRTDSGGIAQFRFPQGLAVRGWVESDEQAHFFYSDGAPNEDEPGAVAQIDVAHPFIPPEPLPADRGAYNWSAQALDAAARPLSQTAFGVQAGNATLTYWSDRDGMLRFHDVPYPFLNLSWISHDVTYNASINLSSPPSSLRTPTLLRILAPQVLPLGESCYRVLVNITDPRQDSILQVMARPEKSGDSLPFTLEQRLTFNESQVHFYRIVCVVEDAGFDILASNQYENTSVRIQLRRASVAQASPTGNAAVVAAIPKTNSDKADEARKIELLVILTELLFFLVAVYVLVRFHDLVLYYGQTMLRFVHGAYHDLRSARLKRKTDLDEKGGPPS